MPGMVLLILVISVALPGCETRVMGSALDVGPGDGGTDAEPTLCGNGRVDHGEECDDGNLNSFDACSLACRDQRGNIVFVSDRSGKHEVWTMLDDGSNQTQVTFDAPGTGRCEGASEPRWSPDGTRIAFLYGWRSITCEPEPALHIVNSDGSGLTPALIRMPMSGALTWTNDGNHIVFTADTLASGTDRYLRIIKTDGTGDATFFDGPNQERDPDYHPFLDRVVFGQYIAGGTYPGIYSVNADGSDLTRLTTGTVGWYTQISARWSSNGARIAFRMGARLLYMNADGSDQTTVLACCAGDRIDWAGDNALVFRDDRLRPDTNISIININGTGYTVLTTYTGWDSEPDWHPGDRDIDTDDVLDWQDNCVSIHNPTQIDSDGDGVGDACE